MFKSVTLLLFTLFPFFGYGQKTMTDRYQKYELKEQNDSAYYMLTEAQQMITRSKNMKVTNDFLNLLNQFITDFSPSEEEITSGKGDIYMNCVKS